MVSLKLIVKLRRYFATGLLFTLPAFFTVYFLFLIFRLIDGMFGKWLNIYLKNSLGFSIPGVGIVLGLSLVMIVGFFATNFFGKRIFRYFERLFLKVPLIKQIYPAAKQIVDSFISKENQAFKKVVLVRYPSHSIWSVGFVTNDSFPEANQKTADELVHIFIATTPSPFTGFLILVPKRDVVYLDIPVEAGIKLIVSGGIVKP